MELVVGEQYQVKVVRILPKGAVVRLADDTTEFVHISNISDQYVNDIHDFIEEGLTYQAMCVKGKVHDAELSLKWLQLTPKRSTSAEPNETPSRYVPKYTERSEARPQVNRNIRNSVPQRNFHSYEDETFDTSESDRYNEDRDRRRNRRNNNTKFQKRRKDW